MTRSPLPGRGTEPSAVGRSIRALDLGRLGW
jgi:hypothetical protein